MRSSWASIKTAEKDVEKALAEANRRRRANLIAIFKEIKVLEKLYEKQYGEYLKELGKSEAKTLEDIISFNAADVGVASGGEMTK